MTQRLLIFARPLTLATGGILAAIAVLGCCCPTLPPPMSIREALVAEAADGLPTPPALTPAAAPAR